MILSIRMEKGYGAGIVVGGGWTAGFPSKLRTVEGEDFDPGYRIMEK